MSLQSTGITQHARSATLLSPILLSCAAKIRDKSGLNGKLQALPDWTTICHDDEHIRGHPFFMKTLGYHPP
jgi:hypothetical protein